MAPGILCVTYTSFSGLFFLQAFKEDQDWTRIMMDWKYVYPAWIFRTTT